MYRFCRMSSFPVKKRLPTPFPYFFPILEPALKLTEGDYGSIVVRAAQGVSLRPARPFRPGERLRAKEAAFWSARAFASVGLR